MDFNLTPEIDALRLKVRAFVAENIVPLAQKPQYTPVWPVPLFAMPRLRMASSLPSLVAATSRSLIWSRSWPTFIRLS